MPTSLGLNATHGTDDFAPFVLNHLQSASALLAAGARFIPITGRTYSVPRVTSDGTASWTAEGAEITSSAPQGDFLKLVPKKLADVVILSRESLADARDDELDAVGSSLAQSVATQIDNTAFSASAATATAPAGLRSVALAAQTGGVTIPNIVRAIGTIGAVGGTANVAFVAPADLTTLRLAADTAGRPLLQPDAQAAGATRVAGARLISTPALPTGTALVADARQIVVGVRRDVEVAFSADAKFTADSIVARVTARADWGWNDMRGAVVVGA